jgi:predicted metal-dependent hydrolase
MKFDETDRGYGNLSQGEILLTIPKGIEEFEQRKMVRDLNSKLIAKIFKPTVVKRINYWNEEYFQKEIKGITLRYNATNWGSCSHKSKINLSTRSLLLPQKAFDYIVVHELSHLVEMNHSKRFWDVVAGVMPDYKEQEAFIKKNSSRIDF